MPEYGFGVSHEMVSQIIDKIMPKVEEWRDRPLEKCYAFLFVDCMYVKLHRMCGLFDPWLYFGRKKRITGNLAVRKRKQELLDADF